MASDFQKRFQRKIADNDEEDEDKEEENNQKPVQLGFTEGNPFFIALVHQFLYFIRKSGLSFR